MQGYKTADLPQLFPGSHGPSQKQACLMEMVSIVNGESFTSFPSCTSETIALIAQVCNDSLNMRNRQLLWKEFPRLFDTQELDYSAEFAWLLEGFTEPLHTPGVEHSEHTRVRDTHDVTLSLGISTRILKNYIDEVRFVMDEERTVDIVLDILKRVLDIADHVLDRTEYRRIEITLPEGYGV